MTDPVAAPAHHEAHHDPGFIRTYVFSTDHKMIGKQFLAVSLMMLVVGGLLAMLIRYQLAWPNTPVPGLGWVPEPQVIGGVMSPAFYKLGLHDARHHHDLFCRHAHPDRLLREFPDPADDRRARHGLPLLNMLSFWVAVIASIIMVAGFFVPGGHAAAGWTSYAPLSAVPAYTGVDWGQSLWCISLIVLGIGSLMGSINYITTIINMRAPGHDLVPPAAGHLVAVHHRDSAAARPAGSHLGPRHAPDGSAGRNELLPAGGRRPASALAAPVLVLRPPRGLHHDPSGDGQSPPTCCRPSRASRSSATARWPTR